MERAHAHGRGPAPTERSYAAEVSSGGMAVTAVFLLNRLPKNTIGGDTPYYRMFGIVSGPVASSTTKGNIASWTPGRERGSSSSTRIGMPTSVHMGARRILCYDLRGTPDLHITHSHNSSFELIGIYDASYGTGNLKKGKVYIKDRVLCLWGGSSTSAQA